MRYFKRNLLVYLLVISLLIFLSSCKSSETVSSRKKEEVIVPVKVQMAKKGSIQLSVDFDAVVTYKDILPLAFKVGGTVKEVFVREGDRVRKGGLLAVLDDSDYRNKLALAEATLQAARANYRTLLALKNVQDAQAKADLRRAEESLKMAKANLDSARINYEQAKRDYYRFQALYESGAISLQQLELVKLKMEVAKNQYEAAQGAYQQALEMYKVASQLPYRLEATKRQLESARAAVKQAEASLKDVERIFSDLQLRSPVDGLVVEKRVTEGALVGPGVPAFIIGIGDEKIIRGKISDLDASKLKPGMKGTVTWNGLSIPVEVQKIYPSLKGVGLQEVELKILKEDLKLKHGTYVSASIPYKSFRGILVRRDAIMLSPEGKFVFLVRNGVAKRVKVRVLAEKGDIAVLQGVKEGDMIVVEGQYYLRDGIKVKVKEVLE